jgi:thioredoxin-like negative regulator of GroEL
MHRAIRWSLPLVAVCLAASALRADDNTTPPNVTVDVAQNTYLDDVYKYTYMVKDPDQTAIAALLKMKEALLSQGGPQAAIDGLEKMLTQTQSGAVQRAIHLQLIELYETAGQNDKALDEMRGLVLGAR